jgi:hypothetical protein
MCNPKRALHSYSRHLRLDCENKGVSLVHSRLQLLNFRSQTPVSKSSSSWQTQKTFSQSTALQLPSKLNGQHHIYQSFVLRRPSFSVRFSSCPFILPRLSHTRSTSYLNPPSHQAPTPPDTRTETHTNPSDTHHTLTSLK